jgi:hypothetical protein
MPEYSFCEIVLGYSRLHIRQLGRRGKRPHKKPDTQTLCGIEAVRDLDLKITPFYLNRTTCVTCAKAYIDATAKEARDG